MGSMDEQQGGSNPDDWLTVTQVASEFAVGLQSVNLALRQGRLKASRNALNHRVIRRGDVDLDWVASVHRRRELTAVKHADGPGAAVASPRLSVVQPSGDEVTVLREQLRVQNEWITRLLAMLEAHRRG